MIDYGLEPKLQEIFDYLSSKAKIAYKDKDLICNETLSKNPFYSVFIQNFLDQNFEVKLGKFSVFLNIIKYYRHSFIHFVCFVINMIVYKIIGNKNHIDKNKQLIIIDIYLVFEKVLNTNAFNDYYFADLKKVLDNNNKQSIYLFMFDGWVNPLDSFKVLKILKNKNINYLCQYDVEVLDIVKLFIHTLVYPIKTLLFATKLDDKNRNDNLLKFSLLDGLKYPMVDRYARFLQGCKIAKLTNSNDLLISWYENQTIHKNLYAGIRYKNGKIKIIGAQLFLYSPLFLGLLVDESEMANGTIPDKILVNGSHYLPKSSNIKFEVGPSLRYKKIFNTNTILASNKDRIIVLLSYFHENNINILEILKGCNIDNIVIKAHPAIHIDTYKNYIKDTYQTTNQDIYELSKNAKCVISCATGALIEMASLSIPLIVIKGKDVFDYNPLTDLGQNTLWYFASSSIEVSNLIHKFSDFNNENFEEIDKIAQEYKKSFFNEPTNENIMKIFDF